MITHKMVLSCVAALDELVEQVPNLEPLSSKDSVLSYLPLAHIMGEQLLSHLNFSNVCCGLPSYTRWYATLGHIARCDLNCVIHSWQENLGQQPGQIPTLRDFEGFELITVRACCRSRQRGADPGIGWQDRLLLW